MKTHPFVIQAIAAFDRNSELMCDAIQQQSEEYFLDLIDDLNALCQQDDGDGMIGRLAHLSLLHTIQLIERRTNTKGE